jgi:hypothetical protein
VVSRARTVIAGSGGAGEAIDGRPAREIPLPGVRAVWPADGDGLFLGTHEGCQAWYVDGEGNAHLFLDGGRGIHAGDGQAFDTPGKKVNELRSLTLDGRGNIVIVENDLGFVRMVRRR